MNHHHFGNQQRTCKHANGCDDECLSRSELYAACKELNNVSKHTLQTQDVDAHMFEEKFNDRCAYISANLSRITVITDKCCKRKPCVHHKRFSRILKINNKLREEYKFVGELRYSKQKW